MAHGREAGGWGMGGGVEIEIGGVGSGGAQAAWGGGHSLGEHNRPLALLAAAGLVVVPALCAAGATALWFAGGGGGGGPAGEARRRTGFGLQELQGYSALGVYMAAVALARLRPGRVARGLSPALQSLVVAPDVGFYLG